MLKLVFICSLCRRRAEIPAIEDFPRDSRTDSRGKRETHAHSSIPRGWSARERDRDRLHRTHGDDEFQTRFFCGSECRTAWESAEVDGVDAFRAVLRKAGLEMRGVVDALADVAYEEPPAAPAYEPPQPEESLPF